MREGAEPATRSPGRIAESVRGVRLTTLWVVAAIAVPTAVATSIPLSAVDLAYQIRAGIFMLDAGQILREDVFTSSAIGLPWLNQQWGAQIVLGGLFEIEGWFALAVLRVASVALVMGMLYASCRNAGASRRWSAGLTLAGGIMLAGGFFVRAQLFGVLCFAATQWLLSRRGRHPLGVWWALPIVVLWANTHGSFFLAPVLFAIAWAEDRGRGRRPDRRLLVAGLATIPLALLNPFGVGVWRYVVDITTDPGIRTGVIEWRPPTVETVAGAIFFASAIAVALYVGAHRAAFRWPALVGLGFFFVVGSLSIRGTLWWAMAAPVLFSTSKPGAAPGSERADPRGTVNAALAGILCLIAIAPLIRWLPYRGDAVGQELLTLAPMGITRSLHEVLEPGQPFFNAQQWGSWFELALPDNPVFTDSRFELIPERAWDDDDDVSTAREGWQAIVDRRGFDVLAVARNQQEFLLRALEGDPAWTLVYEDADGAVYVRAGPG